MTVPADFRDHTVKSIAIWRGIAPPNEAALRMVDDLAKVIADFEAQQGALKFEDEPASFETALLEAACVEVVA